MSAPLGILGGTFDPVHFGHLRLAEEAAEILGLERVRWIPAGLPWHRGAPLAAPGQRGDMVRLAIAGNPLFEFDDAEIKQNTPSYTVATLERLRQSLGTTRPIVVLLGSDAFRGLETWHRWREVFALAHVFVAQRPGHELDPVSLTSSLAAEWRNRSGAVAALAAQAGGRIVTHATTALDISASAIRAQLAARQSPRYMLPAAVLDYIESNRLYLKKEIPS